MNLKKTIAFCVAIIASGCTATGPNFSPLTSSAENSSTIYIYYKCNEKNDKYYVGGFEGPEFRVNGKFIGYLASDSYIPLILPLGKVKVELLPTWNYTFIPELKFEFDIKDENTKYFRYAFEGENVSYNRIKFESLIQEVNPDLAKNEIVGCQLNKASYQRALKNGLTR